MLKIKPQKIIFLILVFITCFSYGGVSGNHPEQEVVEQEVVEFFNSTAHLLRVKKLTPERHYTKKTVVINDSPYVHLDILNDDDKKNIQIIAVAGSGFDDVEPNYPLKVYEINLNIVNETFNEKEIYSLYNNYKATDILVTSNERVFLSYITQHNSNNFSSLILIELVKENGNYFSKKVFESTPMENIHGSLHALGGKMVEFDENKILLAMGDGALWGYEKDKFNTNYESINEFGKTIIVDVDEDIDVKKPNFINYSYGHRVPQGLVYSKSYNMIFETEHGPEAGDEINRILSGKNYGWPYVSYGTKYYHDPKKENVVLNFGQHEDYEKPVYSFIPDIGIKGIEQMPKNQTEFKKFKNNFFICSVKGLYRTEISNNDNPRVIFMEKLSDNVTYEQPVKSVEGCRDLVITHNGIIITNDLRVIRNGNYEDYK